ncbi:MAG: hypothetical protein J1E77_08545, partial [Prevotella sp.]|nr:hypothetical protein [Prevotella sp.]
MLYLRKISSTSPQKNVNYGLINKQKTLCIKKVSPKKSAADYKWPNAGQAPTFLTLAICVCMPCESCG